MLAKIRQHSWYHAGQDDDASVTRTHGLRFGGAKELIAVFGVACAQPLRHHDRFFDTCPTKPTVVDNNFLITFAYLKNDVFSS